MKKNLIVAIVVIVILVGAGGFALYYLPRLSEPATPAPSGDLETAKSQLDAGEYASARASLELIVASDDTDAEAYFLLGLACFNLQDFAKAKEYFERSMALDPDRAAAVHHNLGALAYQMGDWETAIQEFESALDLDSSDADTHYQLGATYLLMAFPENASAPDLETLQKAEAEFEQSLALAPHKPEALVGLSNAYIFQNKIEDAITLLEEAVEQVPDMREALFALGRAYAEAGRTDEAKETLQKFLDTDPPQVWAQQAQQLLDQLP